ncbi:MAG: hypothetical protein QNJ60_17975 [Xenococcaceae cyanobacterium MO_188.B19]|nr:hypothetical protein [Xenococcaceae cyanobacterium MO_188.B19]
MKLLTTTIAALCTTVPLLFTPQALANGNHFGVVCLQNKTNMDIRYKFKWGSDSYASRTVRAGKSRWHSWRYPNGSKSSPNFTISFDYDLRPGRASYKNYSLKRYQNRFETCDGAKKYKFVKQGSFLELYRN